MTKLTADEMEELSSDCRIMAEVGDMPSGRAVSLRRLAERLDAAVEHALMEAAKQQRATSGTMVDAGQIAPHRISEARVRHDGNSRNRGPNHRARISIVEYVAVSCLGAIVILLGLSLIR